MRMTSWVSHFLRNGKSIASAIMGNVFITDITLKGSSEKEKLEHINAKKRNKTWMQAASKKLLPVIQGLQKLIGNKNKKIRIELAKLADCLLRNCYR